MFSLFTICVLIGQYDCLYDGNIVLNVPVESVVYINGNLTTSVGTKREYKSFGLSPNFYYEYDVIVCYKGQEKFDKILLFGGQNKQITFSFYEPKVPAKIELNQIPEKEAEKIIERKFPVYVPD
jgi:hypothetical protein